jgi:hypothetical protein
MNYQGMPVTDFWKGGEDKPRWTEPVGKAELLGVEAHIEELLEAGNAQYAYNQELHRLRVEMRRMDDEGTVRGWAVAAAKSAARGREDFAPLRPYVNGGSQND